jgi:hypothetical protein
VPLELASIAVCIVFLNSRIFAKPFMLWGMSSLISSACNRTLSPYSAQIRSFAVCQPGQYGSRKERMRRMGDTLNPSLWKWYHRHGYWATRRKNLTFMKKKTWGYHEVVGLGKTDPKYVARFANDPSRYRPFKNYCRF